MERTRAGWNLSVDEVYDKIAEWRERQGVYRDGLTCEIRKKSKLDG